MNSRFIIPKLAWIIAGLLLTVTLINYTDRLTMSVLVGQIRQSLHLTETDYWQIVSLFFVAYAVMYAVSGCIVDWLGTRVGMALFVGFWSLCQLLHGFAAGKWSFAACRFGLGLAEPGSFPAATKAVGEWFAPQRRALGVGIFNAGSSIGAAVASPLAAVVALNYGWRAAFVFTGVLGFLWLIAWLTFYQPPQRNRWLSAEEAAELTSAGVITEMPAVKTSVAKQRVNWFGVLTSRAGFTLVLARFLTDPVIYFVIFGLPDYLEKERGFNLKMVGQYAWVPYACGGLAYLVGGWLSGRLMRAGWSLARSRKTAMTVGALLLPSAILAPLVPSAWMAIAAMCVIVIGHSIWVGNLMTLPADLFPSNEVATAAGFSGMGGAIGGALAFWFTGSIISHFSYLPIFICAGLMHPTAILLVWWLLPERIFKQKISTGDHEN
jgi:MFS transporter, ACS family, aldohexuronate transporter